MNGKHKIFLISGKNPLSAKSGYASYAYHLSKLLTSLGYEIEIFCFGSKNQVLKSDIGTISMAYSRLFSTILKDVEMAGLIMLAPTLTKLVNHKLNSDTPTIIWGIGPWSLTGAFIKLLTGKKVIFLADYFTTIKHEFSGTISALNFKDYGLWPPLQAWFAYITIIPLYSLLELFLLKLSDKIITHYRSTEAILTSQFGISHTNFARLPSPPPVIARSESSSDVAIFLKSNLPLILLVCRHDGRKGINYLLYAFSLLNKRGIKYQAAIAGAGPLLKKHQELAKKLGLNNIAIPGFVPDTRIYFKKASIFTFPSLEEGSSALAILEAMKAEIPIVSTNVDGIPEDLIHNKSAILVPPKNPQALADGMEKLLKDPQLAKNLGRQAKIRYYQKYNLNLVKKAAKSLLINIARLQS